MMNAPECATVDEKRISSNCLNQSKSFSFRVKPWLKSVWQWLENVIYTSAEPRIWQKVDRQGRIVCWKVFDPASGQTIPFGSELEVQLWLEQRYRR